MTPAEFHATLSDAEVQLTRIKHLYEQWFQGVERLEPTIPRKQFDRALNRMRKSQPRNTAMRFRFQSLIQRYTTLQTYWRRISRQIEEGTYRRDLMKARRRREARRAELKDERQREHESQPAHELTEDNEDSVDELIAEASERIDALFGKPHEAPIAQFGKPQSTPPSPAKQAPRPIPSALRKPPPLPPRHSVADAKPRSSPGMLLGGKAPPPIGTRASGPGEARIRQIFDQYVATKKSNNERVDNVNYEKVAKSIKQMVPKLNRKYKGKCVDFQVVVKDGRVGIKPVVKK